MTPMPGMLCLQGGREFTPACREMDLDLMESAGIRTVAVLAGAARVGTDYDGASGRARRHYEGLGATVVVIPDPRSDRDGALTAMADGIDLVVLPGGSPSSLLGVLSGTMHERLVALHDAGTSISGASAGAMVLCAQMVRPDRAGDVTRGLGFVDGLALPHWSAGAAGWSVPDVKLWGLPECGGVIVDGAGVRAVGQGTPSVRVDGEWSPIPR